MKSTYKKILIACLVMGLGLLVYDYVDSKILFEGKLLRNETATGPKSEELQLRFKGNDKDYTVEISDRGLTQKQLKALFRQATEEIDKSYLGKNKSADQVMYDLNFKKSYCDGLINADFKFDKYGLINTDGTLVKEYIPDEGEVVNVIAELSYEDQVELYSFSVMVVKPGLDTVEGQLNAIDEAVKKADESTRTKSYMKHPKKVEDMPLTWKKKMNFRGLQIILLGFAAVAGLIAGAKRDEKQAVQKRIEEKERDYPMIVSELSILLGAGMSFRKALERIIAKYNAKKSEGNIRPGYEDMAITYRKMVDGMGEIAALEDMGLNSESKEYRKLASMLSQNLRKGSKDLLECLEKEEHYSFEMRKQRAIRAGEEASTKLLVPMTGMLFIVIIILVVPAVMQMNI